jgi:hypothetical protein
MRGGYEVAKEVSRFAMRLTWRGEFDLRPSQRGTGEISSCVWLSAWGSRGFLRRRMAGGPPRLQFAIDSLWERHRFCATNIVYTRSERGFSSTYNGGPPPASICRRFTREVPPFLRDEHRLNAEPFCIFYRRAMWGPPPDFNLHSIRRATVTISAHGHASALDAIARFCRRMKAGGPPPRLQFATDLLHKNHRYYAAATIRIPIQRALFSETTRDAASQLALSQANFSADMPLESITCHQCFTIQQCAIRLPRAFARSLRRPRARGER